MDLWRTITGNSSLMSAVAYLIKSLSIRTVPKTGT
jgi:hypothetical protein